MTVLPEVDDFINRFPEFLDVDEGRIEAALALASTYISDDWIDEHQLPALLYLTAHILFYELSASSKLAKAISGEEETAGAITAKTVGPLTIKYGNSSGRSPTSTTQSVSDTMAAASPYLAQYQNLMRISFPAVLVVI